MLRSLASSTAVWMAAHLKRWIDIPHTMILLCDVVIIIDPKNSKRLKGNVIRACQDCGRGEAFVEFHPAFPERGVRFDPMFNWQKPTELASRIQSVMPPDTAGSFSAFGWDAVNVVVQGMVDLEDRPNLTKLSQCIEGGIEDGVYE